MIGDLHRRPQRQQVRAERYAVLAYPPRETTAITRAEKVEEEHLYMINHEFQEANHRF